MCVAWKGNSIARWYRWRRLSRDTNAPIVPPTPSANLDKITDVPSQESTDAIPMLDRIGKMLFPDRRFAVLLSAAERRDRCNPIQRDHFHTNPFLPPVWWLTSQW